MHARRPTSSSLAAFEALQHAPASPNAPPAFVGAGPAPPPAWATGSRGRHTATLAASASFSERSFDQEDRGRSCPSLLILAASVVAKNIHTQSLRNCLVSQIPLLPYFLKELILSCRAGACRTGDSLALLPQILKYFADRHMRCLDVSHSKVDIISLKLLLPKIKPSRHIVRSSWDEDSASDDDGYGSDENGTPLQSLNLSYTHLDSIKLYKVIFSSVPNLQAISFAGCFSHSDGPQFLSLIASGLINLRYLDVSFNKWLDATTLQMFQVEKLPLLDTLVLISIGCGVDEVRSYFAQRWSRLRVKVE
ncbi:hypothetical protein HDU83_004472 [Entophlyctis luteolus]|nr:hypothetical protein HDU83_004472 [Entophlyctis luteolus]KAJ3378637.1 hypothetical protein HDU84_007414 [Entophlyctis sp. JEL0112]